MQELDRGLSDVLYSFWESHDCLVNTCHRTTIDKSNDTSNKNFKKLFPENILCSICSCTVLCVVILVL